MYPNENRTCFRCFCNKLGPIIQKYYLILKDSLVSITQIQPLLVNLVENSTKQGLLIEIDVETCKIYTSSI